MTSASSFSMLSEERQRKLFEAVKRHFASHRTDGLHDIDHTVRVTRWVEILSEKEHADKSLTIPAAILHDIARPLSGEKDHAAEGALLCKTFLRETGYDKSDISKISKIVAVHSISGKNQPETLEAKILFDGDKLDGVGPIGLCRLLLDYINKGNTISEAAKKSVDFIKFWKGKYGNPPFFTETAKGIAKKKMRLHGRTLARSERRHWEIENI